MAEVKDAGRSAAKWVRRSSSAGKEYEDGVRNPRKDWATETTKAEPAYEQGVQQAMSRKAFGSGVRRTGTQNWQAAALAKGPSRFTQGVQTAEQKYLEGYAPYQATLQSLQLPARGPKGDPANINRVAAVTEALHNKKMSIQGGGS